jgi:hypothetical protein
MKRNDPRRNLIPMWHWGDHVELYTDPRKAPRWVLNRGALRDPCDVAGCKRLVMKGEWYIRHPFLGVVCRDCSVGFGVVPSEAMERLCGVR